MMNSKEKLNKMVYQLRDLGYFKELESGTGAEWVDKQTQFIMELLTLKRLAGKHHRLAEMDCNGSGVIRGIHYYAGKIDDYARRQYGAGVQCAYAELPEVDTSTIFQIEYDKVESKIKAICDRLDLRVEFQGDPRGYTVKVFKGDRFLDIQGV